MLRGAIRACVLVLAVACTADGATTSGCEVPAASVRFADAGARLTVRVADDDDERTRGLMGVTSLPPDDGMAFVWESPTEGSFWMKDTLIPLSIAFVDERGTIVTIREMVPCRAEPCATYEANAPYVMAVEANAGWYETNGIREGAEAILEPQGCQ